METKRPTVTTEMVLAAAKQIAEKLDADAATIAKHYTHPMDGYRLARELERCAFWDDLTMDDVEELDNMSWIVSDMLRTAEKQWAEENKIQPQLAVGTRITRGVITGISDSSPACYLVKEDGCTQENRFLVVRFEDAKPAISARPRCAVNGMVRPGAMCGSMIVGGKLCGYAGECQHKVTNPT